MGTTPRNPRDREIGNTTIERQIPVAGDPRNPDVLWSAFPGSELMPQLGVIRVVSASVCATALADCGENGRDRPHSGPVGNRQRTPPAVPKHRKRHDDRLCRSDAATTSGTPLKRSPYLFVSGADSFPALPGSRGAASSMAASNPDPLPLRPMVQSDRGIPRLARRRWP